MKGVILLAALIMGALMSGPATAQSLEVDKIAPIPGPYSAGLNAYNGCSVMNCYGDVANGDGDPNSPATIVTLDRTSAEWPEAKPYIEAEFLGANNCTNCSHNEDGYFPGLLIKHWQCPVGYTSSPNSKFKCIRSQQAGPDKNSECDETTGCANVGDPINFLSGIVTERIVDFSIPGSRLRFVRYFNSASPFNIANSPLGAEWSHEYLKVIKVNSLTEGSTAYLSRPNGSSYFFRKRGDGSWISEQDVKLTLQEVSESGQHVGWVVHEIDDSREYYSSDGNLQKIVWPDNDRLEMLYAGGRLSSVTDEKGRRISLEYVTSRLSAVVLPDGSRLEYVQEPVPQPWDNDIRLTKLYFRESPSVSSKIASYTYELFNGRFMLAGAFDENEVRVSSWEYDWLHRGIKAARGDQSSQVDRFRISYGASSSTVVSPIGGASTHGYVNAYGRNKLTSSTSDCQGCGGNRFSSRTYDSNGFPDVTISLVGTTSDADYNARGLVDKFVDAVGTSAETITETSWHATYRRPLLIISQGPGGQVARTATWTYNSRGQALTSTQIDPVTNATRTVATTYCEQADLTAGTCPLAGLVTSVDGPRTDVSDVTSYTYFPTDDATCATSPTTCPHRKGDLWKVTNALGQVTETLRYDGAGRVLSVKDANGVVTDFQYHPRGWLTTRKTRGADNGAETDDQITRVEYWPTGLVKKVIQPDGAFTAYTYDAAHRLTDITDNAGNQIHYVLDNAGNRIQEDTQDASGTLKRTLSRVYNQLGQLKTQADAQANPTDFTYDANGNTDTVTDALGRVTDNDYDPLNRLAKTLQDVGGIAAETQFQYDALDNLTKVTDPKGLDTTYTYNGLGDLTQLQSPDTGTTSYTYDSAGNRQTQTDARGITTQYGYDVLNRLTGVTYPDVALNITYSYDNVPAVCGAGEGFALGRLSSMTDGSGSTQYCYDRFGHLVRKVQTTNGIAFVLRYAYTLAGQLQALVYPDGTTVDYVRDAQGRTTEVGVTRTGNPREVLLHQASYHPFGPVAGWTYGNGRQMTRSLDQDYRPLAVQDPGTGGLSLNFGFDAVGNLTQLTSGTPPPLSFVYDPLGRLTETRDGPTQVALDTYSYDKTGNRTAHTTAAGTSAYGYPTTNHRLTDVGGVIRGYDAAGNTVNIGAAKEFVYNAANRMSQVKQAGTVVMNYAYNDRGEQVRKHLGTSNTYTLYDEAGHWLGDYDSSGALLQQALWMDDLPVGLLANGNQLHYIEPDHLGTPRVVIEVARNVPVWIWDVKGEAFGNTAPDQNPDGDANSFVFDMRFPGQRFDAVSGLNQNYFRDYDSATGRYSQSDPISLASDISTYRYAESNPNLFTDHFGLFGSPLEEKFPMPWDPQRCADILRQIKVKRDEIGERFAELDRNPGSLPNTAPGPLRADRMGHITIINILDSQARKLEDDYDRHCRGPGPACPVPVSSPASAEDPAKKSQTAPAAGIGTILLIMLIGYLAAST